MRQWFTTKNTAALGKRDLAVMNRAVRNIVGSGSPTRKHLMDVRMTYKPGMSAADVMKAVDPENT